MKRRRTRVILLGAIILAIIGWQIYRAYFIKHDVVKIGAILPLTGNLSIIGEPERLAIELFRKKHPDTRLQILIEDSQGEAKQAVSIVREQAHVQGVGTFIISTSASILSSIPIIRDIGGILFAITSTPDISDGKNVFQICPNSRDEMLALAHWMREEAVDTIAFIYPSNEFGQKIWNIFSTEYHGRVTHSEAYQLGTGDFRTLLAKIKAKEPPWISFQGYPNDIPTFVKQARELGIRSKFITSLATTWPSTVQNLMQLGEAPIFIAPSVMLEGARSHDASLFHRDFLAQSGASPNWDAYYVYEVLEILHAYSSTCSECTTPELREYVLGTEHTTISGRTIVRENGSVRTDLLPATIRDGQVVLWKKSDN